MNTLKELIRLYNLTDDVLAKAIIEQGFEQIHAELRIVCTDAEVAELMSLKVGAK